VDEEEPGQLVQHVAVDRRHLNAILAQRPDHRVDLFSGDPLTKTGSAHSQSVPEAIEYAQSMRDFIIAAGGMGRMADLVRADGIPLPRINAAVVWDKKTKMPRLQFLPRNLLQALWIQLAYGLSEGISARECRHCGALFTKVGRRKNPKPEALSLLDGFPYPVYPKIFPALTPSEFER
jgi:hypothetical protein